MECEFDGHVWSWRGPAPYHFVSVPEEFADLVARLAPSVTYGWGMVPVDVRVGRAKWRTSLFPKDGGYFLPLRDSVRHKENIEIDDVVHVWFRCESE